MWLDIETSGVWMLAASLGAMVLVPAAIWAVLRAAGSTSRRSTEAILKRRYAGYGVEHRADDRW